MVWRMVKYKYRSDATGFTDEYGALIQAILCPNPPIELSSDVINPQDFKNLLLGPTSSFCEMFVKMAVGLSTHIYNWMAFEWTEEGTLTEEYQSILCSISCPDAAAEVDLSYMLNYTGFSKWDVLSNSVDLVGVDPYDPWPGNGMYVDLSGTVDASHPTVSPGSMRIKTGVSIVSGQSYRLRIDVAGYKYTVALGTVRVRIFQSDNVTAILDQTITRLGNEPFATEQFDFVAGVTDTCKIQVEQVGSFAVPNVGMKIDDVILENLTAGSVLFTDSFEQEAPEFQGAASVVAPVPNDIKNVLSTAALAMCTKIYRLFSAFPLAVYNIVKFEYNSSGTGFTTDYQLLACEWLQHGDGDAPLAAPEGLTASDDTYTTGVLVSWSPVVPESGDLTSYRVYRSAAAITDPLQATLIGTVPGTQTYYEDTSAVAGTQYRYWVRAVQDALTSDWSNNDTGRRATTLTPTLTAITDLKATQGFYPTTTGFIRLMFTLPAGINRIDYKIDIYRNTVNDYPSATRVKENAAIVQYDNPSAADTGVVYENSGSGNDLNEKECIYWHLPASGSTKYYFWVVLKLVNRFNGVVQATSAESDAAQGWVMIGVGDTNPLTPVVVTVSGTVIAVPVGKTRMRVLMIGAGGAASYADPNRRGSGGAAGDAVMVLIPVTPGTNWTWTMPQARSATGLFVNTPPASGPTSFTEYEGRASRLAGPGTEVIQAAGGLSALYGTINGQPAPANSGSETAITNIIPVESWTERGKAGLNSGTYGGRGGAAFGFNRPGSGAVSFKNAGSRDATLYSGSSGTDDGNQSQSGGNNGVPLLLYTFID